MAEESELTDERVALWILAEVGRRGGALLESSAALEIVRLFGRSFCALGEDGRFSVGPAVRSALDRLAVFSEWQVVWNERERAWRYTGRAPTPYR